MQGGGHTPAGTLFQLCRDALVEFTGEFLNSEYIQFINSLIIIGSVDQ